MPTACARRTKLTLHEGTPRSTLPGRSGKGRCISQRSSPPEQYLDIGRPRSRRSSPGLVFGLNYLSGGDGTDDARQRTGPGSRTLRQLYCKSAGNVTIDRATRRARSGKCRLGARRGVRRRRPTHSWEHDTKFIGLQRDEGAITAVSSRGRRAGRGQLRESRGGRAACSAKGRYPRVPPLHRARGPALVLERSYHRAPGAPARLHAFRNRPSTVGSLRGRPSAASARARPCSDQPLRG